MTPMFIQMACKFCQEPLKFVPDHAIDHIVNLYKCRDCLIPKHKTLHKQQYRKGSEVLSSDGLQIDNWYVLRRYQSIDYTKDTSTIYRGIIGVLNSDTSLEPITFSDPVCKLDYIIELPWRDIERTKRKLALYTTFS